MPGTVTDAARHAADGQVYAVVKRIFEARWRRAQREGWGSSPEKCGCEFVAGPCARDAYDRCIPSDCESYHDGCNTCSIQNGRLDACTEMYCERPKEPKCLDGDANGCSDDPSWCYGDCSPNDCAYVSQKVKPDGTLARCKEKNTDGERSALEACPQTCGTCP